MIEARTTQFTVNNSILPEEMQGFGFNFKSETKIAYQQQAVLFFLMIQIYAHTKSAVKRKIVGSLQADFIFRVDNLAELVEVNPNNKYTIDVGLHHTLAGISFSTARGILLSKAAGTILEKAYLPIVAPAAIVKSTST